MITTTIAAILLGVNVGRLMFQDPVFALLVKSVVDLVKMVMMTTTTMMMMDNDDDADGDADDDDHHHDHDDDDDDDDHDDHDDHDGHDGDDGDDGADDDGDGYAGDGGDGGGGDGDGVDDCVAVASAGAVARAVAADDGDGETCSCFLCRVSSLRHEDCYPDCCTGAFHTPGIPGPGCLACVHCQASCAQGLALEALTS